MTDNPTPTTPDNADGSDLDGDDTAETLTWPLDPGADPDNEPTPPAQFPDAGAGPDPDNVTPANAEASRQIREARERDAERDNADRDTDPGAPELG
jgi:hypothetical protein